MSKGDNGEKHTHGQRCVTKCRAKPGMKSRRENKVGLAPSRRAGTCSPGRWRHRLRGDTHLRACCAPAPAPPRPAGGGVRPLAGAAPCAPGGLGPSPGLCLDSEACLHPVPGTCREASLCPSPWRPASSPVASLGLSPREQPPCRCCRPPQPLSLCTWGRGPCASALGVQGDRLPALSAASFLCVSFLPWDFPTVQPKGVF